MGPRLPGEVLHLEPVHDLVQLAGVDTRLEAARMRLDGEAAARRRRGVLGGEPAAKQRVERDLEGGALPTRVLLEPVGQILLQSHRGSHGGIMLLSRLAVKMSHPMRRRVVSGDPAWYVTAPPNAGGLAASPLRDAAYAHCGAR